MTLHIAFSFNIKSIRHKDIWRMEEGVGKGAYAVGVAEAAAIEAVAAAAARCL